MSFILKVRGLCCFSGAEFVCAVLWAEAVVFEFFRIDFFYGATALQILADCVNQRADIFSVAGRHGLKFVSHFADFRGIFFSAFGMGFSVHKILNGNIQGGCNFYGHISRRNRAVFLKIIAHRTGIKSGARGKFLYHQPLIRNLIPQIFLETHA